ncbi:hypothetical protein [Actinomyces sp. MRS3W]|nr:hypothetical protein [Actinomyces sp. MRS3W]MDU0348253.1 hypothetical protein [Actinomyces sp. MRS3W]
MSARPTVGVVIPFYSEPAGALALIASIREDAPGPDHPEPPTR